MMDTRKVVSLILIISLIGCASGPQIVVDPKSITDNEKYTKDMEECQTIAQTYDLSVESNAVLGAAAGGVAVAGVATAVAGAVFAPAIPFIIAGALLGGGAGGGMTKAKETKAREKILSQCLAERGYKTYSTS
jgi:outer membrane lipoprotein SlyB